MNQVNERNLLRVILLSEELVSAIDAVESDNKFWQHEVKKQASNLSQTIIKKHGKHISALYEVNEGKFIGGVGEMVSNMAKALCSMDLIQWGAMQEFAEIVLENPHVTMSEDEKDKLISLMRGELENAAIGLKESENMVDDLHTKLAKMTAIGKQPFHVLSTELLKIKRTLRLNREGNEVNQPRI